VLELENGRYVKRTFGSTEAEFPFPVRIVPEELLEL